MRQNRKQLKTGLFSLLIVLLAMAGAQAQQTVHGTVIEAKHHTPLVGVNVSVKGTTVGTATDTLGNYKLTSPSPSDTLVFSFIGYHQQVVPIQGRAKIDVIMKPKEVVGKNLVVTAFGEEEEKVRTTGAIATIKNPSKTLQVPSTSLSEAFAGIVPGLTAIQRSGQPGANAAQFYIRGISTFSGSTTPLILLDGVRISVSDLNRIDPTIIKSFSILKDAAATAVYGSRGANGVILIKTKTGGNFSHPKINIRAQNTIETPTMVPKYANGIQYMNMYNEAIRVRNSSETLYSKEKIEQTKLGTNKYLFPDVDWYHTLFKNHSLQQKFNINARGGGKKVTYFMGGTYNRANGMLRNPSLFDFNSNIRLNRFQLENNLTYRPIPTSSVSLKLHTYLRDYHLPYNSPASLFSTVLYANPVDFPATFPKDQFPDEPGILFGGSTAGGGRAFRPNPYANLVSGYSHNFQSVIKANLYITQDLKYLTKGLEFQALVSFKNWSSTTTSRSKGYNSYQITNFKRLPADSSRKYDYTIAPTQPPGNLSLGIANSSTGDRTIFAQAKFTYKKQFADKHHISALALYQQNSYNVNNPGSLIQSLPQRHQTVAGKINYSYNNTYIAQFAFGYDGTAQFKPGHRWGFFPSYSGAIVLSNENFWKPLKSVFNLFKIRASYGLVGNDNTGGARFVYQGQVKLGQLGYTTGRQQNLGYSGFEVTRFANPSITWEIAHELDIGVNLRFIHGLSITADWFRENRTDIFLTRNTIPNSLGTSGTNIYGNLGTVLNKGFEFKINYNKPLTHNLFLSFRGTFSYAHNKITARDEPPNLGNPNLSSVGHPIAVPLILKAQRLFIDQADIDHSPEEQLGGQVQPGDLKYKDVNGDGKITEDDRIYAGWPTVPEIEYGFGPSLKYKRWDISLLFQGVAHTSLRMSGIVPFGNRYQRNTLEYVVKNHWSPNNQNMYAAFPRLSITDNGTNTSASTWYMRNGSFIKLKRARIGYTLNDIYFFISGLNLWTFAPFKLWDPEEGTGNGLSYPTQRALNIGLKISL